METPYTAADRVFVSHLTLRRLVGILGVTLPFVLAICSGVIKGSISAYYDHDSMRNIFVGVLFTAGFFLFCYKGYEQKDDLAGDIACVSALGVAVCPVSNLPALHYISAAILFSALSFFSLCLFTKTHDGAPAKGRKRARNLVYKSCGWAMVVLMALAALFGYFGWLPTLRPIFWIESFMLVAFGTAWLVKGNTLLRDYAN